MRLLHVMAGAPTGGAENIFLEDVLALADLGLEQAVVTRPNNRHRLDAMRARGITVTEANFSQWLPWSTRRKLAETVSRFQPDIVQYWMGRAGTFARPMPAIQIGWYGGYYKAERFRHCDYHIGLTKDLVRHIASQGIPEDRIALIHTYAEFPPVVPQPRQELSTPDDAPLLLALARLHPKKGLDILLKAMVDLPKAYAWIAGDGPLRSELEKLASDLGVSQRVRFLGWRDDRARLLAACDVCVFPSRYEPFGTVTVDAWASRAPLVAAAAQGPKAYVENGVNGMLVPIDDVRALREAIQAVLDDPQLRARIIEGGRATYEKTFTKSAFQKDSLSFYKKILSAR